LPGVGFGKSAISVELQLPVIRSAVSCASGWLIVNLWVMWYCFGQIQVHICCRRFDKILTFKKHRSIEYELVLRNALL
jgi:hypothetical protein